MTIISRKTLIGVALIVGGGLALTGCSAAAAPASKTSIAAVTTTPTPPPTPVLGSRQDPYPTGGTGQYDPTSWSFTFLSTNGNGWPAVQAIDPSAPPAAGTAYVLATVKIVAGSTDNPADPSSSVTYKYVGADGNTYPIGVCGDFGDQALGNAGDMYAGATKTVLICAQVPTGVVAGGMWAVAENYVNSKSPTIFFQGA